MKRCRLQNGKFQAGFYTSINRCKERSRQPGPAVQSSCTTFNTYAPSFHRLSQELLNFQFCYFYCSILLSASLLQKDHQHIYLIRSCRYHGSRICALALHAIAVSCRCSGVNLRNRNGSALVPAGPDSVTLLHPLCGGRYLYV
jgi:hypothetical protein